MIILTNARTAEQIRTQKFVRVPKQQPYPRPVRPNKRKFWHTEGIDYLKTGRRSIWGTGDPKTLEVLKPLRLRGTWLHLAAGDGRYNTLLLRKVDRLIASDIDAGALEKSKRNIPRQFQKEFSLKVFDITKKFPIKTHAVNGIFCVGTLHLFPTQVLKRITKEIDRILRPGGTLFIDFATHTKRVRMDGGPYIVSGEPPYTNASAEKTLRKIFQGYAVTFWRSTIPKESYPKANPPYIFESKFLIMLARKPSRTKKEHT